MRVTSHREAEAELTDAVTTTNRAVTGWDGIFWMSFELASDKSETILHHVRSSKATRSGT
jgi:hypothetical protein